MRTAMISSWWMRGGANPITPDIASRLGDRARGIGFNQLAVVLDCDGAAAELIFFNPDGSKLGACGSATRGVADLLMRESGASVVVLRTQHALLTCKRNDSTTITVDMGPPLLNWADIPLATACDTLHLPLPGDPAACSMGNPHCTFFVSDISTTDPALLGPPLERHPLFAEGTNVHFVQVLDRNTIRLRIWERGGGVPAGSGSCGAGVAAIRRGLTENAVKVICDGGCVGVSWSGAGVQLTGPVTTIYSGEVAETVLSR